MRGFSSGRKETRVVFIQLEPWILVDVSNGYESETVELFFLWCFADDFIRKTPLAGQTADNLVW